MKVGDKVKVISNCYSYGEEGRIQKIHPAYKRDRADRAVVKLASQETTTFSVLSLRKIEERNDVVKENSPVNNYIIIADDGICYEKGMSSTEFFEENSCETIQESAFYRGTEEELVQEINKNSSNFGLDFEDYEDIYIVCDGVVRKLEKQYSFV